MGTWCVLEAGRDVGVLLGMLTGAELVHGEGLKLLSNRLELEQVVRAGDGVVLCSRAMVCIQV